MGAPVASHVTGASNPFQRATINHSGLSNSLINIGDDNNNSNGFGGLVSSAGGNNNNNLRNNPFQTNNNNGGAFSTNTLF